MGTSDEFPRIISLVPSWTEYVALLAPKSIVGRTKYCVEPQNLVTKIAAVGGTKNPDIMKINQLRPDLIIANKEENKSVDIQRMRALKYPVFVTAAIELVEALEEMGQLEYILTKQTITAEKIISKISGYRRNNQFDFLYCVWKDPYMVAGHSTYISNLIEYCGGRNVCPEVHERYPKLTLTKIKNLSPDYIFLPDEPYRFRNSDKAEFEQNHIQGSIVLVDGKNSSWYNQRLVEGIKYYSAL